MGWLKGRGKLRRLFLGLIPLLLGCDMAASVFLDHETMAYMTPGAALFGVLSGAFMVLGAAGWLLFSYLTKREAARNVLRRVVLASYGASGLCCLITAAVRADALGAPLETCGSELVFGCAVLLLTGAAWFQWRRALQKPSGTVPPWEL